MANSLKTLSWSFWPSEISNHPIHSAKSKRFDCLFFALVFLCSAVLNTMFLYNQLWQDELYTLEKFVLVPFETTFTDYHSTNNHIISNLVMSAYLKIIGADFQTILLHPEIVRIIPYAFTLLGIAAFYFMSRKIFGSLFANTALVIYCTSLQLYTFGVQSRGYALEILLCTIHILAILRFVQSRSAVLLYLIAGTGVLMLLNLPSTIYYYGGLMLILFADFLIRERRNGKKYFQSGSLQITLALGAGFSLFVLYILAVIGVGQLTGNQLLYGSHNRYLSWLKQPFSVLYRFIDWRFYLIIPVIISLLFRVKKDSSIRLSVFLLLSFCIPFFLFAFHNPAIVIRIWIVLLPVFCIITVHICAPLLRQLQPHLWKFAALNMATLLCSLFFLQQRLVENNAGNKITLDLRYQYHLYSYNPRTVLERAFREAGNAKARLEVCEGFPAGISFYLKGFNIDSMNAANIQSKAYIVVANDTDCLNKYRDLGLKMVNSGRDNALKFYKWYTFK